MDKIHRGNKLKKKCSKSKNVRLWWWFRIRLFQA